MDSPETPDATLPKVPDELSLCDDDIKAAFKGVSYLVGTPTMAQLTKEIKLLRKAITEPPLQRCECGGLIICSREGCKSKVAE